MGRFGAHVLVPELYKWYFKLNFKLISRQVCAYYVVKDLREVAKFFMQCIFSLHTTYINNFQINLLCKQFMLWNQFENY